MDTWKEGNWTSFLSISSPPNTGFVDTLMMMMMMMMMMMVVVVVVMTMMVMMTMMEMILCSLEQMSYFTTKCHSTTQLNSRNDKSFEMSFLYLATLAIEVIGINKIRKI